MESGDLHTNSPQRDITLLWSAESCSGLNYQVEDSLLQFIQKFVNMAVKLAIESSYCGMTLASIFPT